MNQFSKFNLKNIEASIIDYYRAIEMNYLGKLAFNGWSDPKHNITGFIDEVSKSGTKGGGVDIHLEASNTIHLAQSRRQFHILTRIFPGYADYDRNSRLSQERHFL